MFDRQKQRFDGTPCPKGVSGRGRVDGATPSRAPFFTWFPMVSRLFFGAFVDVSARQDDLSPPIAFPNRYGWRR